MKMKDKMSSYHFAFFLLVVPGLSGCAGVVDSSMPPDPAAIDAKQARFEEMVSVDAGSHKELCFQAGVGDRVLYRFEAGQPLDFNLHYYLAEQVYYPVPEHVTAAEKGEYVIPADDIYCLMWTNAHDAAVQMSIRVDGATDATWY